MTGEVVHASYAGDGGGRHRLCPRLGARGRGRRAGLGRRAPTPTPTTSPPPGRFVEVNPSTVEAGFIIGIRASCPDNTRPAEVESRAFGEVVVQPQYGFLTAAATVRSDIDAQSYRVVLDCPDTLLGATTTLVVVVGNRPSRGPATGFGGMAGKDDGTTLLTGGAIALVAGLALVVVTLRRRRPA